MIAGSFLFAILPRTSLAQMHVVQLSLTCRWYWGPSGLRCSGLRGAFLWWPTGHLALQRVPPPMSPRTPPGPPPSTPSDVLFMVPMTPPELLDHLLPPGTPVGVVLQLHALKPSCPEPLEPFLDRPSCPRPWTHHQTRLDPAWKEVASQSQSDLPHRLGESLQAQIAECGP